MALIHKFQIVAVVDVAVVAVVAVAAAVVAAVAVAVADAQTHSMIVLKCASLTELTES